MIKANCGIKETLVDLRKELSDKFDQREANSLALLILDDFVDDLRSKLITDPDEVMDQTHLLTINNYIVELLEDKPLQYIRGEVDFYGVKLKVDENVLIPRPETEELLDWAMKFVNDSHTVLDVGCGSGCISIGLAKHSKANVFAMDISENALNLASKNAEYNKTKVNFVKDDILNPSEEYEVFDIIISNPPYIRNNEKPLMKKNVLNYEPHIALFVDNTNPLIFYKAIIDFSSTQLKKGGFIFFEINEDFGIEVADLFSTNGFGKIEIRKDLSGKDRMVKAQKN